MRGKCCGLGGDLFDGTVESRSGERRRARAASALAKEHFVGIALNVLGLIGMDAQSITDELLEHSLVALPLRDTAGEQRERARSIETHLGAFEPEGTCPFD